MQIAVIGAGSVGRALGLVWHKAGHEVVWGLRDPGDARFADLPGEKRTVDQSVSGADVVLLAVPWPAVSEVAETLGQAFSGLLIDCTNPINDSFDGLDRRGAASGAAFIAGLLPNAKVVKSFNQTGASNMADPVYQEARVLNMIACDDENCGSIVRRLSEDAGFDTVHVRGLDYARQLEEMAWLWISLAMKQQHGRDFAFSMLRR